MKYTKTLMKVFIVNDHEFVVAESKEEAIKYYEDVVKLKAKVKAEECNIDALFWYTSHNPFEPNKKEETTLRKLIQRHFDIYYHGEEPYDEGPYSILVVEH